MSSRFLQRYTQIAIGSIFARVNICSLHSTVEEISKEVIQLHISFRTSEFATPSLHSEARAILRTIGSERGKEKRRFCFRLTRRALVYALFLFRAHVPSS